MPDREQTYRDMFYELSRWEGRGIPLKMEGNLASPMQVVAAHMVKESESSYMRDYVFDRTGNVEEISFHIIKQEDETDTPVQEDVD